MRNDYRFFGSQHGSRHGSQQPANAGNQLEAQLNRLKRAFNIAPGRGTDAKLARVLRLTHQSISIWRQKGIPGKRLKEICQDQKILMDWLLTGEGPMRREGGLRKGSERSKIREEGGRYLLPAPPVKSIIPESKGPDPENFEFIPLAEAYLSAGEGAFVISEEIRQYYAFPKSWLKRLATSPRNLFLMAVKGPSMEPGFMDGDIVMVDTGVKYVYGGYVYALGLADTIVIKRLELIPAGLVRIISDNKEYPPQEVYAEEIRIIGQVIWHSRELVRQHIE